MKIAIFENQLNSVKGAFDTANLTDFNKSLELEYFTSSQNANYNTLRDYVAIFVDIDLSQKSNMDGFGVISKIKDIDDNLVRRIVILTGNNKIREAMKDRNIMDDRIEIIIKPTHYEEVAYHINRITRSTST